jgi:hypothetical protein
MSLKLLLFLILPAFSETKVYTVSDAPEIKIPSKIWDKVQEQTRDESFSFTSAKVRLIEKTDGVLVDPDITIDLPRGGGDIDLSRFVRDRKGTFRIYFEIPDLKAGKNFQAFFVSNARKRKLDGQVWGSGCQKFMVLTEFIIADTENKGIEVNSTRHRHLSVIGGHFIFSAGQQLTRVSFSDSTQPHLFCKQAEKPNQETE